MIELLEIFAAEIPMRQPFVHASHARSRAESVLVRVTAGGFDGWGEGAPRRYVTGETMTSALRVLSSMKLGDLNRQLDWTSFESAVLSISNLETPPGAPAARASVEIALLDLVCRMYSRPLHQALRLVCESPHLVGEPVEVPVSLVLGLSEDPPGGSLQKLGRTVVDSLHHVKLKVTRDIDDSIARVEAVRSQLNPATTVSIDANGAWDAGEVRARVADLAALQVAWIEEPTRARDWETMGRLCAEGAGVMLDESFVDAADLEHAVRARAATHVNLRVSKCGGVLATVRLADLARSLGLRAQVGVQVGELGPLWAAGRAVGTSLRLLETVEAGRQDEWFAEPLTEPPYQVDRLRYRVRPVGGVGTGVVPSPALLGQLHRDGEVVDPMIPSFGGVRLSAHPLSATRD